MLSGGLIPLGVLYLVVLVMLVVGRQAEISRAIIDKTVVVPEGVKIGVDQGARPRPGVRRVARGITVASEGQVVTG